MVAVVVPGPDRDDLITHRDLKLLPWRGVWIRDPRDSALAGALQQADVAVHS
jgi:hypothetical protein